VAAGVTAGALSDPPDPPDPPEPLRGGRGVTVRGVRWAAGRAARAAAGAAAGARRDRFIKRHNPGSDPPRFEPPDDEYAPMPRWPPLPQPTVPRDPLEAPPLAYDCLPFSDSGTSAPAAPLDPDWIAAPLRAL